MACQILSAIPKSNNPQAKTIKTILAIFKARGLCCFGFDLMYRGRIFFFGTLEISCKDIAIYSVAILLHKILGLFKI